MIILQTRLAPDQPWRNVLTFKGVNVSQVETVRRSPLIARLWDQARARSVAESLPAKAIPIQGLKPADVELALTTSG